MIKSKFSTQLNQPHQGRLAARTEGELTRAAAQGGEADQRGGGGAPGGVEAGAAGP